MHAEIVDRAFGPLHAEITKLHRQAHQAARSASLAAGGHLAGKINDAAEEAGLGRPAAAWAHMGGLQVGVPQDHPEAEALWDHEYGTVTSAPSATFRRTFARVHPEAQDHFNQHFRRHLLQGTRWGS